MKDSYIDGVYHPTSYMYQGGTSQGLKEKLLAMNYDYKMLNKIYLGIGEVVSLDRKLSIEELVDKIVIRTLKKCNYWVTCIGENGRYTITKPYK